MKTPAGAKHKQPQPNSLPTAIPKDSPKTSGITTRGNGAATKGTKARGPMA